MRIPNKLSTSSKIDGITLKKAINDLIDVVKSQKIASDGRTTKIKTTPSGTTITANVQNKVVSGSSVGGSSIYNGGFIIKNTSTYDETTNTFTGEILLTDGYYYEDSSTYGDYVGYVNINALQKHVESTKFTITESKSLVLYSEITDTTPFINPITTAIINDIEQDLPTNIVFLWIGDITYNNEQNTFGDDDFIPASLSINQVWKDGSQVYLPAFRDSNLT